MALAPRLEVRQAQSLTLTPQLMQSIKLLTLSHLELNAFVEAELLRNPLLEADAAEPSDAAGEAVSSARDGADTDIAGLNDGLAEAGTIADRLDTTEENVFPEQVGPDRVGSTTAPEGPNAASGEAADLEDYVASRLTLGEHLSQQAELLLRTAGDRLIARHLIDALNADGYLLVDLATIAEPLGVELADVEAVLQALQACEPTGVFARSVRECLALQLRERDRLDPLMLRFLDHLDLVALGDSNAVLKAVGCTREDFADMLGELRRLDPRPGRSFAADPVEIVVPDVFVRAALDGGWAVELNSDVLPKVLVNRVYYARVAGKARGTGEKEFLADCLSTANWLTKSLDQRAQTIIKVAAEIVRQQDGFLQHGVPALKPMTLKMVAEAIDLHESTVSRVTTQKYLATPRGLFEMKYFFTTALSSTSGEGDHSAEAVRHRIKQLIDAEPATAILSDDTIADMLKREQGIDVARRTVAKYREGMNIPSSVVRRRQKQALAGVR